MTESIHVYVSHEHIKLGLPNECQHCPVFWAINDALKDTDLTCEIVNGYSALCSRTGVPSVGGWVKLPPEACEWISRFDSLQDVSPFEFDLPVPPSLQAYVQS